MAARAFHEIMSTRFWDFYPESLHAYRRTILDNIASRRPYEKPEERTDRPYFLSSRDGFTEKTYVGNYDRITYWYDLEEDDRIISVIDVQGPILRNGDLCSYGSKEHKDIIMRASDDAHTIGFIIKMDSPGGSSMAKYDYEMALNYARSKGKKIVGHIDGMACSAGYALMALCDEIYFTNPHDTVGCIGTMCAMFTNKDGDVNTITQERYAEILRRDLRRRISLQEQGIPRRGRRKLRRYQGRAEQALCGFSADGTRATSQNDRRPVDRKNLRGRRGGGYHGRRSGRFQFLREPRAAVGRGKPEAERKFVRIFARRQETGRNQGRKAAGNTGARFCGAAGKR